MRPAITFLNIQLSNSREDGQIITLDCPHYVQDYEYEKIAGNIEEFLRAKM